jgi:hypothetical protein
MKLAVLSNDRLNPWINWSTLGPPVLSALARMAGGTLVSPPPLGWSERREWIRALQDIRRADTLFWMQGSARPELPLVAASFAAGRARRSAFVVDAWKPALSKIGLAAVAQRLDPCFVAFREGCEELRRLFPQGRFEWLPFGIDTRVFDTGPGERDIFAFWMGRRHAPLHEALLRYCEARGLPYVFRREGEYLSPEDLGRLAGRSRYFVVTPPDLDDRARTGGFSPLVMRYLEGLSAGARLLGVLPKSGEYEELLPRAAILEVAPDGSDLETCLDADRANQEGWVAVEHARSIVRTHHSWERRAEQIRDRLAFNVHVDVNPTPPVLPTSRATAGIQG